VRLHRAVVLGLLILLAAAAVVFSIAGTDIGRGSVAALVVVLAAMAVAGAAFSWRRYFPNRR
jgi:predicted Na+-dependent transporter